jgi:two-component system sensor histidine kinase/response regulator
MSDEPLPNVESRAMARFTSAFTHAFRSRLNAVLGSLELVSQTQLDASQSRFVDTAVDEGRALLQLVNDTLDLARLDAGELRLAELPIDPVAIAEGALGTVAAGLHARGVAVASIIDPQTPVSLRGDGFRLRQVLVNLLDNARKATESGSVVLSVRPAPGDTRGEHLSFEVRDSGRGVPDSMQENLFAPILPQTGGTDLRMSSLGIGLALCRRLVERMGGQIRYAPRRGGGSVFSFDVRLQRDSEFERLSDLVADARGRRVLLVDGDAVRRATFGEQLQSWGLGVRVVPDGRAGAELLQRGSEFDLLLVHQDAPAAADVLREAARARSAAVLVPIGMQPRLELAPRADALLWLSAPMRRQTIIDATLGKGVPSIESPEVSPAPAAGERARVLVLEDSDANQMVMLARLQRLGCQCDAVNKGSDAVRLVSQRRYGLVLADLSLPDMSGLEVAAAIRQIGGETARVPIVAVTGDTHPRDRERCLAAGMNDYLTKPVDPQELMRVIERYVPRSPAAVPVWEPLAMERMTADLGPELAIDVLSAFERELGQRLARLGPDYALDRIGREAHAMKSAAATFGADRLSEAARELEQVCSMGQEDDGRRRAAAIVDMGRAVQVAVQRWLEQARGGPA